MQKQALMFLVAAISVYINNNLVDRVKLEGEFNCRGVAIINQYIDAKQKLSKSVRIPK